MRNHGPVNYTIEPLLSDEFSTLEFMATLNPMAYANRYRMKYFDRINNNSWSKHFPFQADDRMVLSSLINY